MRHTHTDQRNVKTRVLGQATWSAVATVMLAGTSIALAQHATQSPVNTGLSNIPGLSSQPTLPAQNGTASQNRNVLPSANTAHAADAPPAGDLSAGDTGSAPAPSDIKVDDNLIVDLHLNNEDLSKVLEMLSIQSQRNIVASGGISNAKVSANLYGVTFYEALDAILHPNGFGYIDRGNMIYVHTLDELKQIEQASRVRVSKLVTLSYLNAIDAAEFVKPLLSEGGSIKTPGKTKDFAIPAGNPTGADEYALDATLVIYDYEENVAEIEKLLSGLDTKPAQVLVEATIVQTSLNEQNAFGVDFSMIADMKFNDFSGVGGPLKAVESMISGKGGQLTGGSSVPIQVPDDNIGRAVVSTPGNTAGPGTLKVGIVGNDVAVFIKMLDEVSDTTILSNPKILAVNRQPAHVLVGRKVGYLNTTSTDTTTTQSVEFLDTGTQLYFRPFVSLSDNTIRMELKPQVSEAVIRNATDVTGAAVTIPDEITNEMTTNVMVKDGQTIVLGGLFRESTQSSRKQVPFLGDIPLIGSAFRGHDDEVQRSEIIFLITPSIVKDELLAKQGKIAQDYVNHARTGAREGLLPWSREKMTGMKLIEAQKLAAAGEPEKARWKLQQSLSLNSSQPDAIGLLQQIGGEVNTWPSRSVMEDIVHNEVKSELKASNVEYDPDNWTTPAHGDTQHSSSSSDAQQSNDSASVTFTPAQPTDNQGVTTENDDSNANTFGTTPDEMAPVQSDAPSDVAPGSTTETTPNSTDGQFHATPSEPTQSPSEFTPNTDETAPNQFDATPSNDPSTPNNTSESSPSPTPENSPDAVTTYDSGTIYGSTVVPASTFDESSASSTTSTDVNTSNSVDTTNTSSTGSTAATGNTGGTAIAGTQAERQAAPAQDSTPATDSSASNAVNTNGNSADSNQAGTTTTTDNAVTGNASTDATPTGDAALTASETNTSNAETGTATSPTDTSTTNGAANTTNTSATANTATNTNNTSSDAHSTTDSTSVNPSSSSSPTDTDASATNAVAATNAGFEASESNAAGVVHGEKSNVDILTNAVLAESKEDGALSQENAENSPKSENSASGNADSKSAAGANGAAVAGKSAANKTAASKATTGQTAKSLTSKPSATTKSAKANTKESKAAKAKAAQEAKKKKSSWGIFDFLRPSDDDEKTVTKGQDDTGPPSNQK